MDPDSVSIDGPYLGPNLGERTFCRRRTIPRSSFEVDYKSTPDIESALPKNQYLKREIVYVFLFYVGRGLDFVGLRIHPFHGHIGEHRLLQAVVLARILVGRVSGALR
jgi:hypothetical protein